MAQITAALVKELRDQTGAGMMDCKTALTETDADLEGAVDWLRKKGLAAAAKKAGRVAAEGLVGVAASGNSGALVEINSETDFVSRNEEFQSFVRTVSELALETGGDFDALSAKPIAGGKPVADSVTDMVAKIGENINLRRSGGLSVGTGVVASYVHSAAAPGLGRIGVLVGLESSGDAEKLQALGRQVAMHVAAANPQWLSPDDVDPAALERERSVLIDQAKASGRPDNIIEKMVEGRIRKFFEEVTLLEQVFVIDTDKTVRKAVEDAAKEIGAPVAVTGFLRFGLGEGIERAESDFAAEVAATLGN